MIHLTPLLHRPPDCNKHPLESTLSNIARFLPSSHPRVVVKRPMKKRSRRKYVPMAALESSNILLFCTDKIQDWSTGGFCASIFSEI